MSCRCSGRAGRAACIVGAGDVGHGAETHSPPARRGQAGDATGAIVETAAAGRGLGEKRDAVMRAVVRLQRTLVGIVLF